MPGIGNGPTSRNVERGCQVGLGYVNSARASFPARYALGFAYPRRCTAAERTYAGGIVRPRSTPPPQTGSGLLLGLDKGVGLFHAAVERTGRYP